MSLPGTETPTAACAEVEEHFVVTLAGLLYRTVAWLCAWASGMATAAAGEDHLGRAPERGPRSRAAQSYRSNLAG